MGMKEPVHQGDIIKVENVKTPVFVASKDFFNQTGEIIGCPIMKNRKTGALHISIQTEKVEGVIHCEKLALLDLNKRGFLQIDRASMGDIINITDAIQGIFDYIF
jgi:mRNA-degrading endonuclease toxin of MazEF toxin-antitoxin module